MTLRRALWASPLAISVAVLAHLVAFGSLHAPGAANAAELLGTLAASLTLGLAGAFAGGLSVGTRRTIATERPSRYAPLLLAAAGTAAFGLIELSEGHLALPALLEAALASLPLAYFVTFAAACARRAARDAGALCADLVTHASRDIEFAVAVFRGGVRVPVAATIVTRGPQRGRAPPNLL